MKKIINEQPDSTDEWIKIPPPLKGKVDTTKFDVSSDGDWYKIKENIPMNEHMIMLEQPDNSGNWEKLPENLKGKIDTDKFKVSEDGNWYIDKNKLIKPDAGTEKKFKTNDGEEYTVGMLGNDIIQFANGVWKDTKGWTTENIIKIKEKLYNLKRGDSVYDKNKQTTKFPLEQGAYTTKGDPYQYKVVNGQWFAKSLENRGKIFTNWRSLANNAKAISILDKRHPNARTVKPKVDNTQQKAGETQTKYKDQFGQMSKDAENLPKTIFGTKGETNPIDNTNKLNVNTQPDEFSVQADADDSLSLLNQSYMRKNRYVIEESEKIAILAMHKSLMKEQGTPAPATPVASAPVTPAPAAPVTPQAPVVDTGETQLRKAMAAGCLGTPDSTKLRKNTNGTKFAYITKTKSGKEILFFGDMTYKFRDGSKSGNWKCDQIEQQASQKSTVDTDITREIEQNNYQRREDIKVSDSELAQLYEKHPKYNIWRLKIKTSKVSGFTDEQQAFINQWKEDQIKKGNPGFTETLNPAQRAKGTFKAIKVSGTEQLFPNGGLIMYREPAVASDDIKSCKEAIEKYYTYWREDSEALTDSEFNSLKPFVQSCANRYHKRWGGVFSSIDNYVKILSGDEPGGPSSYGSDSKFRLKSPKNVRR